MADGTLPDARTQANSNDNNTPGRTAPASTPITRAFWRRKNFREITGMTGAILKAVGYPSGRLRDFLSAVQAVHREKIEQAATPDAPFTTTCAGFGELLENDSEAERHDQNTASYALGKHRDWQSENGIILAAIDPTTVRTASGELCTVLSVIDNLTPIADAAMEKFKQDPRAKIKSERNAAWNDAVAWGVAQLPRIAAAPPTPDGKPPKSWKGSAVILARPDQEPLRVRVVSAPSLVSDQWQVEVETPEGETFTAPCGSLQAAVQEKPQRTVETIHREALTRLTAFQRELDAICDELERDYYAPRPALEIRRLALDAFAKDFRFAEKSLLGKLRQIAPEPMTDTVIWTTDTGAESAPEGEGSGNTLYYLKNQELEPTDTTPDAGQPTADELREAARCIAESPELTAQFYAALERTGTDEPELLASWCKSWLAAPLHAPGAPDTVEEATEKADSEAVNEPVVEGGGYLKIKYPPLDNSHAASGLPKANVDLTTQTAKNAPDLLAAALAYAARGWAVFPCHTPTALEVCDCYLKAKCKQNSGKHPRTMHGFKDATTDAAKITKWWTWWPHANIGIATGPASNLIVLDVDIAKPNTKGEVEPGGEVGLMDLRQEILEEYGADLLLWLDSTPEVITGGNGVTRGRQYYFAYEGDDITISAKQLGAGLDVRGNGGYVIAPESLHWSMLYYEWGEDSATREPLPLPEALRLKMLPKSRARLETGEGLPDFYPRPTIGDITTIADGARNDTLFFKVACPLRGQGADEAQIRATLSEFNQKCVPPLEPQELDKIAASVMRYTPNVQARLETH